MNEMTRVATNGSWVTMIMNTRAGSNGARRAQARLRAPRDGCGLASVVELVCSATEVMMPSPLCPGLVPLGDVLGQPLPPFQGLVDRHLTGDRRAHVLRHLGAQVGELGDVDELDADRRPRLDAGVARVGAGD